MFLFDDDEKKKDNNGDNQDSPFISVPLTDSLHPKNQGDSKLNESLKKLPNFLSVFSFCLLHGVKNEFVAFLIFLFSISIIRKTHPYLYYIY